MTKHEAIVISAYTGILMCGFGDLQKYAQELAGRPVWTHEFADKEFMSELREKSRPEFLAICEAVAS